MTNYVDCPRCGGYGFDGIEEDTGCPFACYFCGTTGRVPAAVAEAERRERQDEAERFTPRHLGIYMRPMRHEYDWDDCEPSPGHRLFTRLVPPPRPAPVVSSGDDDVPF
jgi:hypothetical protein